MSLPVPLLDIRNLTITYGSITAVSDVSLSIRPGEVVGLVGESGSGKSSIAISILDLLEEGARIESGSIMFDGIDLRTLTRAQRARLRGRSIGTVFQDPFTSLNPALTVGFQIAEPLIEHKGLSPSQALRHVLELLAEVGIRNPAEMASAYPHQLSGGMLQRALIATALACEPKLLLLDEPTTALDVTVEAKVIELLAKLCRNHNLSALFVSHNLGVVSQICKRCYVLYAGEVLESGPASDILRRPSHPYSKGLIASLPKLTSRTAPRLPSIPGSLEKKLGEPVGCVFSPRCPFAESRCATEAQSLRSLRADAEVRCWKADQLTDQEWPQAVTNLTIERRLAPATKPIVEIQGLRKVYEGDRNPTSLRLTREASGRRRFRFKVNQNVAINDVSFAIKNGETVGLVGESGSGKSTIGRSIVGLVKPTAGQIIFDGLNLLDQFQQAKTATYKRLQLVFQNSSSSLNPRKTLGETLERSFQVHTPLMAKERRSAVKDLLVRVGLPAAYASRYPHQVSGGERQRVNIARALATSPNFIVCDEAVSALDVSVQANILNLLADLRDEYGLAYLFISHDIAVVAHISDRIIVLYAGSICEEGTAAYVLQPPYHPYTEALLSAVPRIDAIDTAPPERILLEERPAPHDYERGCAFRARCPRKVGPICDEERPPLLEAQKGHRIACHIPIAELERIQPTILR